MSTYMAPPVIGRPASGIATRSRPSLALALTMAIGAALLTACGSTPQLVPASTAPVIPPLEQFMSDAAKAREEGAKNKERDTYRAGARAYPTRKEPWLKLADSYFEAGDYGNAILAAQEVLQRDANDNHATSLLAVSGLRVSTSALSSLRQQNNLGADTRTQAEGVVRTLRDVLGENALVPSKAEAVAAPAAEPRARRAPRAPAPAAAPTATTAAPAAKPAATAAAPAPAPAVTPVSSRTAAPAPVPAPAPAPAKKADDNPFKQFK